MVASIQRLLDKVRQWFGDYYYRTPLGAYAAMPHGARS